MRYLKVCSEIGIGQKHVGRRKTCTEHTRHESNLPTYLFGGRNGDLPRHEQFLLSLHFTIQLICLWCCNVFLVFKVLGVNLMNAHEFCVSNYV